MSDEQSINSMVEEFKKAGWLFALLGGLGMLARLILTDEKYNAIRWTRMVVAGTIVGVIAYFALYNADIDPFYKSVLCSISGSLAPELFDWVRKKFLQKASN
jgi:hypothetical protein